jgi:hypothetical protein
VATSWEWSHPLRQSHWVFTLLLPGVSVAPSEGVPSERSSMGRAGGTAGGMGPRGGSVPCRCCFALCPRARSCGTLGCVAVTQSRFRRQRGGSKLRVWNASKQMASARHRLVSEQQMASERDMQFTLSANASNKCKRATHGFPLCCRIGALPRIAHTSNKQRTGGGV